MWMRTSVPATCAILSRPAHGSNVNRLIVHLGRAQERMELHARRCH